MSFSLGSSSESEEELPESEPSSSGLFVLAARLREVERRLGDVRSRRMEDERCLDRDLLFSLRLLGDRERDNCRLIDIIFVNATQC